MTPKIRDQRSMITVILAIRNGLDQSSQGNLKLLISADETEETQDSRQIVEKIQSTSP
jgi:hypothetical protein